MKATIIYDNTAFRKDLQADWGFSALIEAHGKKILFDTGANGTILLSNMDKLEINPKEIDDIFISHAHFDHTGGLSEILDLNSEVAVWVPCSVWGTGNIKHLIEVKKSTRLHNKIYSTGELEGIEQSLCIDTRNGIVIIAGCSHPQMAHIIDAASGFGDVWGIIGGLHGSSPESLENFNLICPTHCTLYKQEMKLIYPQTYVEGGAGKTICI